MAETKIEFIFKDAYGYQIRTTIVEWDESSSAWTAIDISSFTTKDFKIEKPDGTFETTSAAFETDGTDGILIKTITSAMAIVDQVGWYKLQVILANATQHFPTQIVGFSVDDAL